MDYTIDTILFGCNDYIIIIIMVHDILFMKPDIINYSSC